MSHLSDPAMLDRVGETLDEILRACIAERHATSDQDVSGVLRDVGEAALEHGVMILIASGCTRAEIDDRFVQFLAHLREAHGVEA